MSVKSMLGEYGRAGTGTGVGFCWAILVEAMDKKTARRAMESCVLLK
jgi:hypothetical protein